MEALGLLPYFSVPNFGGFGSDYCSGNTAEVWRDRSELVSIAAKRVEDRFPGTKVTARYHVGDTPYDIKAAEAAGATAIGVVTGTFSREELVQSSNGSAIILDDLTDVGRFLASMGL